VIILGSLDANQSSVSGAFRLDPNTGGHADRIACSRDA
jgi:hypothetical protein